MKSHNLPSCSRCTHGIASVIRYSGSNRYSFAFRCSCSSGNAFPGLPLVDPNEQTVKEATRREYLAPPPSAADQQRLIQQYIEEFDEIPF